MYHKRRITPAQRSELHGGFVLPNRLVRPIVRGNQMSVLLLNPTVVDVRGNNARHHADRQINEQIKHIYHLLSLGLMPSREW